MLKTRGFRTKTPPRRTPIASLSRNRGLKRKTRIRSKKTPKGTPAWIKAIPVSKKAHGSGHLQKRLWRLTSDYVRIRDANKHGKCVATNIPIKNWNMGQAGHYRGYTSCNGMFKFHPMNIHLQSAQSNAWPNSQTWETFAINLRHRYGMGIIDEIDMANRNTPLKITTELVMEEIEKRIADIERLDEKPPYFERLQKLRSTLNQMG